MANIDPKAIQNILDDIERLKAMITEFNGPQANELDHSQLDQLRAAALNGSEKFNSAQWYRFSEQRQRELEEQLLMARGALQDLARRAGRTEIWDLPDGSLSVRSMIWLAICAFIFAATLFSLIR